MTKVRTFTSTALPPYDRGYELGERLHAEVAATAAAYRRLFAVRAVGPFDVDLWSERAWVTIQRLAPAAAEEIAGIAEGARRPVREIAAVNARTELLAVANPTGVDECSTVVALPPGRPPVAVQTWDWYDAMADNWLHWTIPHPDGRVVETVTEVGMLAKIGVSSAGVGVLLNMLHHASDVVDGDVDDDDRLGYPVHLRSRRILDEARDVDDAVAIATTGPTSASTSLTVLDAGGRAVSVELFPAGQGLLEPTDGVLLRTNHFVSAAGAPGCTAAAIGPGTRIRLDKLRAAFDGRVPETADAVVAAMHDHAPVGGICAHPDTSLPAELWHATLATVAVDVSAHTLAVSAGGPCARPRRTDIGSAGVADSSPTPYRYR
ncbi:MAG: C45 family autoproteolytic acyltransferase/hydrolase [Nocardioidaceae bacterium]